MARHVHSPTSQSVTSLTFAALRWAYLDFMRVFKAGAPKLRVCVSEAARFPDESAQYCYVIFTEVEMRLAAYLKLKLGLSPQASAEAAQKLLGQVLHPRFPRALFGVDPLMETFDEKGLSPGFDLKPIRKAVADVLDSIGRKTSRKAKSL